MQREFDRLKADAVIVDGRVAGAIELVHEIRSARPTLPVLFVAPDISEVAAAAHAGANDFVLAESSPAELVTRLRLLTTPAARPVPKLRRIGPLSLDREARTLRTAARSVQLSPIELKMFERLLFQAGRPVSRSELERAIWKPSDLSEAPTNIAVVYVSYLRRKLARLGDACQIKTITNVGYTLEFAGAESEQPRARVEASLSPAT